MPSITATELEFLGCLGADPALTDDDVPWCYNTATYTTDLGGVTVTLVLQPSYRQLQLVARQGDRTLYELNAADVVDVLVLDEPGIDALDIQLSDRDWLRVTLRPAFGVSQRYEAR